MKYLLPLIALTIVLSSCGTTKIVQELPHHVRYFPKEFSNLHFGMTKAEALKARKDLPEEQNNLVSSFRQMYKEEIYRDGIDFVTYYFDNEGEFPLYEMIISYNSIDERDRVAYQLLGSPNSEDTEWQYDSQEGFYIRAWTFEKKLIIVGTIPGSEWAD